MNLDSDGLRFVQDKLECFKNGLNMAKGLFGMGWS